MASNACYLLGPIPIYQLNGTDIQHIDAPKNINVIWLSDENSLVKKAKSLPWLSEVASVWSACEFEDMRKLRTYFQNDKDVARGQLYISSYWKRGISEDGHKALKQQDAIKTNE